ncbi:efflux RND transporter periplasmic adaptor subunit [Candidatus Uhrbacteria bacterium]|nr:efflux RND transporter periplasmic adaptor subunit [Candidatus Uhrbacteria bacterium]
MSIKSFFGLVRAHKIISLLILAGLVWGGLSLRGRLVPERETVSYSTQAVETNTIIMSVSGTGQIANVEQVDLKPGTSETVTQVNVSNGQSVRAGAVLVRLDASDVAEGIQDAETALETAKLQLERLMEPADEYDMLQAQNSVIQAKESESEAVISLGTAYDDAYGDVTDAFLSLPNTMSSLVGIINDSDINGYQADIDAYSDIAYRYDDSVDWIRQSVRAAYDLARADYDLSYADYKRSGSDADRETIERLLDETLKAAEGISVTAKEMKNLIDFVEDILTVRNYPAPRTTESDQEALNGLISSLNSMTRSLKDAKSTVRSRADAVVKAARTVEEREMSLNRLMEPPDELDIRSQRIAIQQKENALRKIKGGYSDYVITAPFDGVVANVGVKVGESVSSGTVAVTLITAQKVAEISLNEVDITGVSVGQKATIEFDSIDDFSITGTVVEVDAIGTTSQGVVSYGVKISLDTQDDRIKTGMSVSAAIVTQVVPGTLTVPNSAIKSQNGQSYVEILERDGSGKDVPVRVRVTVGTSDDANTEILEGLAEGDMVITKTVTGDVSGSQTEKKSSGSLMQMMGGSAAGGPPAGGMMR